MKATPPSSFTLALPADWQTAVEFAPCQDDEDRMQLVLKLAEWNVQRQTGGPFAAAVFEIDTGRLIAAGMNVVVSAHCSLAHAEAMAIALAQERLSTHNLAQESLPALELVTSGQPCIQCFGMIWWSGISRLVVGARKEDIEKTTGFVEGPVPPNWVELLSDRSPLPPVETVRDVCRDQAIGVLQSYYDSDGPVYSPGD